MEQLNKEWPQKRGPPKQQKPHLVGASTTGKTKLQAIKDGSLEVQPRVLDENQHRVRCQIDNFEEWGKKQRQRSADKAEMNMCLRDPSVPGLVKQHRRCDYIMKYGRTLFSCPNCWLLPGLCVCRHMATFSSPAQVYVHVHHSEWGKSSNTGTVSPLSLPGQSRVLLKGHAPHEELLTQLFQDPTVTTAILWPGEHSVLPSELKQIAEERTGGRIAVVAVDASWDAACRMKSSYPSNAIHVRLGPDSTLRNQSTSLLFPVRRYRGDVSSNGRVSTLEAIAYLLYELNGDEQLLAGMLDNLKIKVDAMLVQKLRPPVYNTVAASYHQEGREAAARLAEQYLATHGTQQPAMQQAELDAMAKELMGSGS